MNGKEKADLYCVKFGSNTHFNSAGILRVRGKELLRLERGSDDQLLVSTKIRNEHGVLLGRIWRNAIPYVHPDYEQEVESKGGSLRKLLLRRKSDGAVIFEADVTGRSEIEINGIFNLEGKTIVATREYLQTGTMEISHSTFDSNGADISIS